MVRKCDVNASVHVVGVTDRGSPSSPIVQMFTKQTSTSKRWTVSNEPQIMVSHAGLDSVVCNGGVKGSLRRPPDTPRDICECCPLTGRGVVHGMDSKALHRLDDPFQDKGGGTRWSTGTGTSEVSVNVTPVRNRRRAPRGNRQLSTARFCH